MFCCRRGENVGFRRLKAEDERDLKKRWKEGRQATTTAILEIIPGELKEYPLTGSKRFNTYSHLLQSWTIGKAREDPRGQILG